MEEIINNTENLRFEIHLKNGEIAYSEYRFYKKDVAFMHTVVPESAKGQGLATRLAAFAFVYAKKENTQVMVFCPFVGKYVNDHPEVKQQLDKELVIDFPGSS